MAFGWEVGSLRRKRSQQPTEETIVIKKKRLSWDVFGLALVRGFAANLCLTIQGNQERRMHGRTHHAEAIEAITVNI